ncbi:MAG: hypothetical protein CMJ83_10970 [Planctomycetes bacterium]|nr:hypothetical protein [Planctomycetota bacterium]
MSIAKRKRSPLLIAGIIIMTLAVAFASWFSSSFRRDLSDDEILERLEPGTATRDIQHALSQLEARLSPKYDGRERFREKVIALASNEHVAIRRQVAWVMGREPGYRERLVPMLDDADVGVQFNAALSLSNSSDPRARPVLLAALRPVNVVAPASGTLEIKVDVSDEASLGYALGLVKTDSGDVDVRPPLSGVIESFPKGKDGPVSKGDVVALLAAAPTTVNNALVALKFVGRKSDLPAIRPFVNGGGFGGDAGKQIRLSAERAVDAIERR